jgi:glycosyltransferase involved in cell wall biosynthesis
VPTGVSKKLEKLRNRKIHGIDKKKIYSTDALFFRQLGQKTTSLPLDLYLHKEFSKKCLKWGFGSADTIYNVFYENLDFVKAGKEKGLKIITDVCVSPTVFNVMQDLNKRFPEISEPYYHPKYLENYKSKIGEALDISDLLLCPSEYVAQETLKINPAFKHKIRVVPYGFTLNTDCPDSQPQRGRIFFAGYEALRKGLPFLAEAATQLKMIQPEIEIRVAGPKKQGPFLSSLYKDLIFLGPLDKSQMAEELKYADAFILPTFSEGLAAVVIEAMVMGVPVLTTLSAGISSSHLDSRFIIETGKAESIVEKVKLLYQDRYLREELSHRVNSLTVDFSLTKWAQRLSISLKSI